MSNLRKIIADYLRKNKYDGLCNLKLECGCGVDDLAPCGSPSLDCESARAITLKEGEYIGDYGPGDMLYMRVKTLGDKNAVCSKEARE